MLELEKFEVVEMSSEEIQEIEGGIWPIIVAVCILGGAIYDAWNGNHPPP